MTRKPFPVDPTRRKAILVLAKHDIERCSYEPDGASVLLDDETFVLQYPIIDGAAAPPALQNLLDSQLVSANALLVQSPFDPDSYEDVAQAPQKLAIAKHMYFSTLCMHLGAKEVRVDQVDLSTRTGKSTLDLKADHAKVGADLSVESQDLQKLKSQMTLHDHFTGGPVDAAAAERLLRRTGLWADQSMRSLLEVRREGGNSLTTRTVVLNLSSEAKSNISVAARLKMPSFLKLSADYKRVVQEQSEYKLTVFIRF